MSTLKVTNIQATGETATRAVSGVAAAWVNFNGTGTVSARDSENVSSITDNGTGDYAVNFSNNMSSNNFSMVGTSCYTSSDTWVQNAQGQTTSFADIHVTRGGSLNDASIISINIHGDLA